jgi:hypothetical protein
VSGPLFGEAVGVLFVTCRALAYWIAGLAAAVTVVCVATVAGVAWAIRRARRGLSARLPASQPECDPSPPRAGERPSGPQQRPAPSWVRTEPDQQEAA